MGVVHPLLGAREVRQLVVVGREERARREAGRVVEILGDRPGDRETVEGARASADLVQNDQASGRGLCQDLRRLAHLDHERRLAPSQPIRRAHAREDAVDDSDLRRLGGHEAARLGQQGDQRHLTEVGALAGHVGARQQQDLGGGRIEVRVVRHEAVARRPRQNVLDDRVAPRADLETVSLPHLGPHPTTPPRHLGERRQGVDLGNPQGSGAHFGGGGHDLLPNGLEDLSFELGRAIVGSDHAALHLGQLRSREALHVRKGLLALVVGGYATLLALRDLERVAVNRVVADLEGRDAGPLPFLCLEPRDPLAPLAGALAQDVELRTKADPHVARLVRTPRAAGHHRRIVDQALL